MADLRVNPLLDAQGTYPFVRLTQAKQAAAARGIEIIDLGVGEPREATPPFINEALVRALLAEPVSTYPAGDRAAGAAPRGGASGCTGASARRSTPTTPSSRRTGPRRRSSRSPRCSCSPGAATSSPSRRPATPSARAARPSRARRSSSCRSRTSAAGSPTSTPSRGSASCSCGSTRPGNPTGAVAPLSWLAEAAARCREHGVVLASDEAYCEIYFGDPPPSALQLADHSGVLAFHTLSKRSSMPGHRSGFVAGDPALVGAPAALPPEPRHGAAGVRPARVGRGLERGDATSTRPAPATPPSATPCCPRCRPPAWSTSGATRRSSCGCGCPTATTRTSPRGGSSTASWRPPGSYLGAGGEGHLRLALVPTVEACERAAELVARLGT